MFFSLKKRKIQSPPPGMGVEDIRTESSICTGETVIGFYDPAAGKLLRAVAVHGPADVEAFYRAYGFPPPHKN